MAEMAEVSGYYLAYPASDRLRSQAKDYIAHMQAAKPGKDVESLTATLRLLAYETIDIYLIDLFRCQELHGMHRKLLNVADKAIKTTTSGVIKQVAKKLDIGQQQYIARHIDSCLLPLKRENLHEVVLIACPVQASVYERLRSVEEDMTGEDLARARDEILTRQKIIFDTMVDYMVERLIVLIRLGPINQRIVRTAIDKCVSLTHSTFEKMVATMDQNDLKNTANHIDELLLAV